MSAGLSFEAMWRELAPVGRSATSGGYHRQPFATADLECRGWFVEECDRRGLRLERDGNGNLAAWWDPIVQNVWHPDHPETGAKRSGLSGVLTGSHLDSVIDGGAYDGPLGVVSALAAIDVLRERGFSPLRPIGVSVFVEEEGSRFPLACLGSRLATGSISAAGVGELRDRDGIPLLDAMTAAGLEPDLGPSPLLASVGTFVELHVEQGRDLVDRERAVGVASGIWPHGRFRFDFRGEANHAGTTRMEDRHDPMLSYAMTALAANKQARLSLGAARATFGRIEVAPNGTNAVPARVTGWLDARCESTETLTALVADVERLGAERAGRDGTTLEVTAESLSPAVAFDAELATRLSKVLDDAPVIPTMAGHDAGVLAAAGIPSAMLFVRNPTGVSHSPTESIEMADCLAGVEALADVLTELAR